MGWASPCALAPGQSLGPVGFGAGTSCTEQSCRLLPPVTGCQTPWGEPAMGQGRHRQHPTSTHKHMSRTPQGRQLPPPPADSLQSHPVHIYKVVCKYTHYLEHHMRVMPGTLLKISCIANCSEPLFVIHFTTQFIRKMYCFSNLHAFLSYTHY